MIDKLKDDLITLGAIFEVSNFTDERSVLLVPSLLKVALPPYTASSSVLLSILSRNNRVTPLALMKEYGRWVMVFKKNETELIENIEPHLLSSLGIFLKTGKVIGLAPVDEFEINSSSLVRLGPLAFYLAHYHEMFSKNPPFMYHLIASLSSLTVGHRRAALACGLYLAVVRDLLLLRLGTSQRLTHTKVIASMRLSVQKALIYYHSTLEYGSETGYFAVLQTNAKRHLHLEGMQFDELHQSEYAVDVLLQSFWIVFNVKSTNVALKQCASLSRSVATITGMLYGIAYGVKSLSETTKKRFQQLLKPLQ